MANHYQHNSKHIETIKLAVYLSYYIVNLLLHYCSINNNLLFFVKLVYFSSFELKRFKKIKKERNVGVSYNSFHLRRPAYFIYYLLWISYQYLILQVTFHLTHLRNSRHLCFLRTANIYLFTRSFIYIALFLNCRAGLSVHIKYLFYISNVIHAQCL